MLTARPGAGGSGEGGGHGPAGRLLAAGGHEVPLRRQPHSRLAQVCHRSSSLLIGQSLARTSLMQSWLPSKCCCFTWTNEAAPQFYWCTDPAATRVGYVAPASALSLQGSMGPLSHGSPTAALHRHTTLCGLLMLAEAWYANHWLKGRFAFCRFLTHLKIPGCFRLATTPPPPPPGAWQHCIPICMCPSAEFARSRSCFEG